MVRLGLRFPQRQQLFRLGDEVRIAGMVVAMVDEGF
jgi:hypothetical protein